MHKYSNYIHKFISLKNAKEMLLLQIILHGFCIIITY